MEVFWVWFDRSRAECASLRCSSLQNVGPQFVRPIKLDFRKLNLILVEKIEFDCHVPLSGPADPPAIPRRFAVQVLLTALEVVGPRGLSMWTEL